MVTRGEGNDILQKKTVYSLLSKKGKQIYFPKKGVFAQSAEAEGCALNATIGMALDEDKTPMRLQTIVEYCPLQPEKVFPYASSFGVKELRKKWRDYLLRQNLSLQKKEISLPIVTNGLTEALSITAFLFVDSGDAIILPSPYWENYSLLFGTRYGAVLEEFPLFEKGRFNLKGLESKITTKGKKKIVLLNFPNNPTGYTITKEEAEEIVTLLKSAADQGKRLVVICDDAYFGLQYEPELMKESLFALLCDAHENILTLKIDGASKELYAWGLRVGFLTFGILGWTAKIYTALEEKVAGTIRADISNVSRLSQSLVLETLNNPRFSKEKKEKDLLLERRYRKVLAVLEANPHYKEEFTALPFNSGYFMCIKPHHEAEIIRRRLREKYDTGVLVTGNLLRIAFSSVTMEEIPLLFENLYKACKEV
ncbi:aminotransferase class I/II-fold pyridoxal phosphate-dependent enzyme [Candidatus Woesearchaeota archaeon]|nr:aminotransferase class I/II-fold pyridoxal phosphate-dependent enzyme [Candidatus Woesearchaeota archaeon]